MSAPQRKAPAGRGPKYDVPAPDLERLRLLQQKLQEQQHLLLLRQQDAGVESETAVAAAQAAQEAAAAIAAAAAGKEDYSWVGKPGVSRGRLTKTVSGSEFRPHRKRMVVAPPSAPAVAAAAASAASAPLLAAMRGVAGVPAAVGARSPAHAPAALGAGSGRLVGQSAAPAAGAGAPAVSAPPPSAERARAPAAVAPPRAGVGARGAAGAPVPVPAGGAAPGRGVTRPRSAEGEEREEDRAQAEKGEEPEESTASLEAAVATASYYDGVAGEFPPPQSAWFRIGSIHEIERLALPEFFDGRHAGLTPRAYKAMRDTMVRMSLENPAKHLAFTHCRRAVPGAISAVHRVYQFLDHWGLINSLPTQAFEASSGAPALAVPFPGTFDDVAGALGTAVADAFLRAAAPEDTAIKVEDTAAPDAADEVRSGTDDTTAMVDSSSGTGTSGGDDDDDGGQESTQTDVPIKQDPDAPSEDAAPETRAGAGGSNCTRRWTTRS